MFRLVFLIKDKDLIPIDKFPFYHHFFRTLNVNPSPIVVEAVNVFLRLYTPASTTDYELHLIRR